MNVGINLQLLRAKKNVSQQEVADYLGVTRQAYSFYENNKRQPDYETLLKLAEYFGICIGRLFDEPESIKNPLCLKGGENVMELETMSEFEFLTYARLGVNFGIKMTCEEFLSNEEHKASKIYLDRLFTLLARQKELTRKINELVKQNPQEELS